jgi:hypothetical protein
MRAVVFILLVASWLPRLVAAQTSISGIVRDSLTQQPLPFASVFLANTTLGATTSEQGNFTFPRVPAGTYDLVISYIGYRLGKQTVVVGTQPQQLALRLSPSANRLGEVVVHARPTRPEDYQKFVELFIGTSTFSQQCRIRNPKAIRVDYDAAKKELSASADEFVQVDNQALGYRLKYYGMQFRCNFEQQVVIFYGQPVFEELTPRNARQQRQWLANRLVAYRGSLTHFLRSVHHNSVAAEGFQAQKVRIIPNPHFPRADSLRRDLLRLRRTTVLSAADQDSIQRWHAVPASFMLLYPAARPIDSLRRVAADGTIFLHFTDELQVAYFGEAPDPRYGRPMAALDKLGTPAPTQLQVSRLNLVTPEVKIQPNGSLVNPLAVFVSEYWGFEKMGEFSPLNYLPPSLPPHDK